MDELVLLQSLVEYDGSQNSIAPKESVQKVTEKCYKTVSEPFANNFCSLHLRYVVCKQLSNCPNRLRFKSLIK